MVLTPGDAEGRIPKECFERVIRIRKERILADPEEEAPQQALEAPVTATTGTDEGEVKTTISKRGKGKGGVRFWDEVIWEYGQPVNPPRQQARVSMKF